MGQIVGTTNRDGGEATTETYLPVRRFHEVGVRAFQTKSLVHSCRCSREKVATTLASLPRDEIEGCKEDGTDEVVVTCQFCNAAYRFDDRALAELYEA